MVKLKEILRAFVTSTKCRYVVSLLTLYCVSIANCFFYELFRTSSPLLNYLIMSLVLLIPLALFVFALTIKRLWLKILLGTIILPFLLVSSLMSFVAAVECVDVLRDGKVLSFEPVHSVELGHSRIVIYRTNGGATTSFGIVGRQERPLLPGILLVRRVYSVYPGYEADVIVLAPDTIKIISPPYIRGSQSEERVIKLKRWVYF